MDACGKNETTQGKNILYYLCVSILVFFLSHSPPTILPSQEKNYKVSCVYSQKKIYIIYIYIPKYNILPFLKWVCRMLLNLTSEPILNIFGSFQFEIFFLLLRAMIFTYSGILFYVVFPYGIFLIMRYVTHENHI